jgi:hypothetical protein
MTLANSTNASGNRGTEKTLIAGFSINGSITFSDVNRDVKLLAKLENCDSKPIGESPPASRSHGGYTDAMAYVREMPP